MTAQTDFNPVAADPIQRVELAIKDVADGKMVILVDDEDRENEGDLIFAADKVTPDLINFMAVHARGLICLPMMGEQIDRLALPMMAANNQSLYETAFTVSIEAREGVTTGISAADRAHTVAVAIDPAATARTIVTPGHMFPLRCRPGGVLERVGQTEGSVDLARLAGCSPAAVICEIIKDDGTMARRPDLEIFGRKHGIRILSVADIIEYRMRNERVVTREAAADVEIPGLGTWKTAMYRGVTTNDVHMALWRGELGHAPTLARVQGAPPPWSAFVGGLGVPARSALQKIESAGEGVLVLMHCSSDSERIEAAYRKDFDVAGPSTPAPAAADLLRDLGTGCQILADLGLRDLRLLSSSNRPIAGIEAYGLRIVDRLALDD